MGQMKLYLNDKMAKRIIKKKKVATSIFDTPFTAVAHMCICWLTFNGS